MDLCNDGIITETLWMWDGCSSLLQSMFCSFTTHFNSQCCSNDLPQEVASGKTGFSLLFSQLLTACTCCLESHCNKYKHHDHHHHHHPSFLQLPWDLSGTVYKGLAELIGFNNGWTAKTKDFSWWSHKTASLLSGQEDRGEEEKAEEEREEGMMGHRSTSEVMLLLLLLCWVSEMTRVQGGKRSHLGMDHFYVAALFAYFRAINKVNDAAPNAPSSRFIQRCAKNLSTASRNPEREEEALSVQAG